MTRLPPAPSARAKRPSGTKQASDGSAAPPLPFRGRASSTTSCPVRLIRRSPARAAASPVSADSPTTPAPAHETPGSIPPPRQDARRITTSPAHLPSSPRTRAPISRKCARQSDSARGRRLTGRPRAYPDPGNATGSACSGTYPVQGRLRRAAHHGPSLPREGAATGNHGGKHPGQAELSREPPRRAAFRDKPRGWLVIMHGSRHLCKPSTSANTVPWGPLGGTGAPWRGTCAKRVRSRWPQGRPKG
jgi:hypothetical protein